MALKAIVDQETYDGLDSILQSEYRKNSDGKLQLAVTAVDGMSLDNVASLKSSLQKERENVSAEKEKVKSFEGIDATEAKDAISKVKDMADWTPSEEVQKKIDAKVNQMAKKHKDELEGFQGEINLTTAQLQKAMIDTDAISALSKERGKPKLLLPHIRNMTRLKKSENGAYIVEVLDGEGNVRISPEAGNTGLMSVEELVAEMKVMDDFAPAFDGSGQSGSGSGGSESSRSGSSSQVVLTKEESRDPHKYRAARELATKEGKELAVAD